MGPRLRGGDTIEKVISAKVEDTRSAAVREYEE